MNNEILEGNKIIAEFMGGKLKTIYMGKIKQLPDFWDSEDINSPLRGLRHSADCDTLQYSSWDWLMHVVEKIEAIGYPVVIENKDCIIHKNYGVPICKCGNWETKIQAVWQSVTSFIQWYNSQKIEFKIK